MATIFNQDSPSNSDVQSESLTFLVIDCPDCDQPVLTARDLDSTGEIVDVCMHCNCTLSTDSPSARWIDAQTVLALGYFVDGVEIDDGEEKESGCRGGSCGIRQP